MPLRIILVTLRKGAPYGEALLESCEGSDIVSQIEFGISDLFQAHRHVPLPFDTVLIGLKEIAGGAVTGVTLAIT